MDSTGVSIPNDVSELEANLYQKIIIFFGGSNFHTSVETV